MKCRLFAVVLFAGVLGGPLLADISQAYAQTASGFQGKLLTFTSSEAARILQLGPWPMAWAPDPSNRVSGRPEAVAFGRLLFFEKRLSGTGTAACATCHVPEQLFTDGRIRGQGFVELDRNTPSLVNVRLNRWFGWDGAADSLWSQSLRPILDKREMRSSPDQVGTLLRGDAVLAAAYETVFGAPPVDDDTATVNVGKALAAFQETLTSGRTSFDEFRDALERGDTRAAGRYPIDAQRGLRIFVGRGNCVVCHLGPNFSNGEFGDIGMPFFAAPGRVDPGRYEGIRKLQVSRVNLLGKYNDDPARAPGTGTRHVTLQHRNWGEFRVPSLRNLVHTAPYMHAGRLADLAGVVRHYSELNEERLHADGERILRPLRLSAEEAGDLVRFLRTLSGPLPGAPPGVQSGGD